MGYNVSGSPFNIPALALPYKITLPNLGPGYRLWIVNTSSYVFYYQLNQTNPKLCPANYNTTVPLAGSSVDFTITATFGTSSGSLTSNLFLYVLSPDDPDYMDGARTPISTYPSSPNYGFAVAMPNGGVYSSQQKGQGIATIPNAYGTQLDTLDFPNVIFWEDWLGYSVPTGTAYSNVSFEGGISPPGYFWGHGTPTGMAFFNQIQMHYTGAPKCPICIAQPAANTTTFGQPIFPQFPFIIANAGVEMVVYGVMGIGTTIGTGVTTYQYFLVTPTIVIGIQVSGPGYTTTTIQAQCYNGNTATNQNATFVAAVAGQGTAQVNYRIAVKLIKNAALTYDLYCSYSNSATNAIPTKSPYVFVMTLNGSFPALANITPGFSLQTIIAAGTTTTATSIDMGISNTSAKYTNGLYPPSLQINIP